MLVKSDVRQPLAFAMVLAPLLGFRTVKHYMDLRNAAAGSARPDTAQPRESKAVGGRFFQGELLVANVHQETPDVKTFRLINPHGGEIPFRHQPGQYMTLQLDIDGERVRRSYTIASAPSQRGYVELTIKRHPQGLVSKYMHDQVQVGHRIQLGAPGGKFWFDGSSSQRVLLIAGGVGITPTMSMLRYLTDTGWPGEIIFLNAARTAKDLIFDDELRYLASRHSNFVVVNFLSQARLQATSSGSSFSSSEPSGAATRTIPMRVGYISAEAIAELVPDSIDIPVYLCGPESMMTAIRAALAALGVSESKIYTEEFISPKNLADNSQVDASDNDLDARASVEAEASFTRSGVTIRVERGETILEAAERNNVRLESECRSGVCGQCKVRCSAGRVAMETAYALSLAEKREGWILACQARATSAALEIDA
jgi:ferredoxin-NADP reductase